MAVGETDVMFFDGLTQRGDIECVGCLCDVFHRSIFKEHIDFVVSTGVGIVDQCPADEKIIKMVF